MWAMLPGIYGWPDAGEHVGEPRLGIDVVHLGRHDQAVHLHCPLVHCPLGGRNDRIQAASFAASLVATRARSR
jgi:hypothetical protein